MAQSVAKVALALIIPQKLDVPAAFKGLMAMARATAAETTDRIDTLLGLILEGEPNTACLTFARQEWGVSRAQGYRLLKRAWTQIKADVDETGIDRQELLAWSIQTLMAAFI